MADQSAGTQLVEQAGQTASVVSAYDSANGAYHDKAQEEAATVQSPSKETKSPMKIGGK